MLFINSMRNYTNFIGKTVTLVIFSEENNANFFRAKIVILLGEKNNVEYFFLGK